MSATIDFGIDLGTTNSCVARWEQGGVRVFQSNDQMNVTPSAVYIHRAGRKIVGLRAQSALRTDPNNVATEFKRWMGQKDQRTFPASKQSLSAEELSAEVLKSLREDVRRHTGIEMTAAVITVPAAFGALQCEATARAALLAGIAEAPLLQEPIAAAIAYGVGTESSNQRWLVFDLGGGTLDIAVISTREGRLSVLEHLGNNMRGGKDIDRLIVEQVLLPAIEQQFDIRSMRTDESGRPLYQQLRAEAERAKIALSTQATVAIALYDLGDDDSGKPIEVEIDVTRARLESLMEPMLDECMGLARSALSAARVAGSDLDRILLVGGPTQIPIVRSRLAQEFGAPVDYSLDAMTVVAHGAALYATTLQRTTSTAATQPSHAIPLKLAYEPVCADLTCAIAGRVSGTLTGMLTGLEVKFDSEGGFWTSGWIAFKGDFFETGLQLTEGEVTLFRVSLRDSQGRLLETDTTEVKIRHALVPSDPPLPHTISIEVVGLTGKPVLDVVFPRGTSLPSEKIIQYRTARVLIPGKAETNIYIKLWEGEFLDAPDANQSITSLELSHDGIKRRLLEGSVVEVKIEINASRLISVTAFVPVLNQHFSNEVYLPQRGTEVFEELAREVPGEIREYNLDLQELCDMAPSDPAVQQQIQDIRTRMLDLEYRASFASGNTSANDPEDARRLVAESRCVHGLLLRFRHQLESTSGVPDATDFFRTISPAVEVVERYGTSTDKQALTLFRRELDQAFSRRDNRSIQRLVNEFRELHFRVLASQDWYWQERFKSLSKDGGLYLNRVEAERLLAEGRSVAGDGKGGQLEAVVRSLWRLLPKDAIEEKHDLSVPVGIKKC
jgi:molecular chaperone DnaK